MMQVVRGKGKRQIKQREKLSFDIVAREDLTNSMAKYRHKMVLQNPPKLYPYFS